MVVLRHSVAAEVIEERVRARLDGPDPQRVPAVAWAEGTDAIVIHLPSVKLRIRKGWLLCNVEANAPGGPRALLQMVYFLGRDGQSDDTVAASTIHAAGATSSALADQWGVQLQRVIWDGVLDALEGVLAQLGRQHPGKALDLIGFSGSNDSLDVDVEVKGAA
jgi:hypothetical protein